MTLKVWLRVADQVLQNSPKRYWDGTQDEKAADKPGKLHRSGRCIFKRNNRKGEPDN